MNKETLKRAIFLHGFCHPAVGATISGIFRGRVPYKGFVIDTNNVNIAPTNIASIFWGLYERPEVRLIRQYLRPDLDVIELGSSLGIVSLNIVKIQERSRKLICLEANPLLVETVKSNLKLNADWKRAEVVNMAVDYSGAPEVSFSIDTGNLGSHIVDGAALQSVRVGTTTLSGLLQSQGISDFALVSDIEGAEAGIIIEDAAALRRCRQIIIELHPTIYKGQTLDVPQLRERIESVHGFQMLNQHRNVFVFGRA